MPPSPPPSAAAAAAHRSTQQPPSDLRGLCEHGIQDGHLVANQHTASAPLCLSSTARWAACWHDLRARPAMRKEGNKPYCPTQLTHSPGPAATDHATATW